MHIEEYKKFALILNKRIKVVLIKRASIVFRLIQKLTAPDSFLPKSNLIKLKKSCFKYKSNYKR